MSTRVIAALGAIAVVLLILLYSSFFEVTQTEQALVLQFGRPIRLVTQPGLQMKLPYQDVIIYDRRILDFEAPAEEVIASDQKRLVVDTYARFRIANPLQFFQSVGTEAVARTRLASIITGALRRVIGNVALQEVVANKRAIIMQQIRKEVNNQSRGLGIDVVDVRIRRADLPEENSQAVYDRMKSERQREAAQFRAEGAQQAQQIRADADKQRIEILANAQKQAQILRGEGDADSIHIYADAYSRDKDFYAFYRSLQAYRDALTGPGTTLVLTPTDPFFRYLDNGPPASSAPATAAAAQH